MIHERVKLTLRFFWLQNIAPTSFEVWRYLLPEPEQVFSFKTGIVGQDKNLPVKLSQVSLALEALVDATTATEQQGFFAPSSTPELADKRFYGHKYGSFREKLIRKYAGGLRHVPFIRGVALGGSQALGQEKADSDIDLFVITHPGHLWLGRIFISLYFQIFNVRRHGKKEANRFCLNHYLAGPQELTEHRDLYNAFEYAKFRPLLGAKYFQEFYNLNVNWLELCFAHIKAVGAQAESESTIRNILEKLFTNPLGKFLETQLGQWQLSRIKRGSFVVANQQELAFHELDRKFELLNKFFTPH